MATLGELIAGITHELRQLLNNIKIMGQSLIRSKKKNKLDEEQMGEDISDIVNKLIKRLKYQLLIMVAKYPIK